MRYFILLVFFSVIYWTNTFAQADFYTKKYSPQQLQEDFQTYKEVLSAIHPSLYWYTSKQELDSIWNSVEKQLDKDLSKHEFFNLLAPATAKINCGHTGSVANTSDELDKQMPLAFRYLGDQLYLYKDFTTQSKPMKIVRSINGHSVEEMLYCISNLHGTDGFIETPKPLVFNDPLGFNYRYHLVYDEDKYRIQFEDGTEIIRNPISVDSLKKLYVSESLPLIEHEIKADKKIASLTINTFDKYAYKNKKLKYKKEIKAFFKKIKTAKIEHLIIDLRRNGGGEDNYASFLYRYLTDQSFQYYKSMETLPLPYSDEIKEKVYLPFEVRNGLVRRFFIKKKGDRFLVKATPRTKGLRMQKPAKNAFLGKVYFLTSGASYSASAELATFAKVYRPNTLFIGQETGGAMQGNTSAIFAYLTLKHTNISTYIPLVRYHMNVDSYEVGRGVIPDYPIIPTVEDVLAKKDTEMNFVMELIQKEK